MQQQKNAKETVTYCNRNPPGTPVNIAKYKHRHLRFYTNLGHRNSRNKMCFAYGMGVIDRAKILQAIVSDAVAKSTNNHIARGT